MSIRTTADEMLDTAREQLLRAAVALADINLDRVSGARDFTTEFQSKLRSAESAVRDALDLVGYPRS